MTTRRLSSPRGAYRQYLTRDSIALVIPYGPRSTSMLWHARTGMYFRMAGGDTGTVPAGVLWWPIVDAFTCANLIPEYALQLKAFLAVNHIASIIVADGTPGPWRELFSPLGVAPVASGGVAVYRVPLAALAPYSAVAPEMRRHAALDQFSALLLAADAYVSRGMDQARLSIRRLEELGLLPSWGCPTRRTDRTDTGLWLHDALWAGPSGTDSISLGVIGTFRALEPLVSRFAPDAEAVYFPYPAKLSSHVSQDAAGPLLMVFTRAGITQAAHRIRGMR